MGNYDPGKVKPSCRLQTELNSRDFLQRGKKAKVRGSSFPIFDLGLRISFNNVGR